MTSKADNIDTEWAMAHATMTKAFPKGSTVYTILRHCSRSGMLRHISVVSLTADGPRFWSVPVAKLLNMKAVRSNGDSAVKVGGCGMDMGFHVAYELSHALYGDGYALNHRWL